MGGAERVIRTPAGAKKVSGEERGGTRVER